MLKPGRFALFLLIFICTLSTAESEDEQGYCGKINESLYSCKSGECCRGEKQYFCCKWFQSCLQGQCILHYNIGAILIAILALVGKYYFYDRQIMLQRQRERDSKTELNKQEEALAFKQVYRSSRNDEDTKRLQYLDSEHRNLKSTTDDPRTQRGVCENDEVKLDEIPKKKLSNLNKSLNLQLSTGHEKKLQSKEQQQAHKAVELVQIKPYEPEDANPDEIEMDLSLPADKISYFDEEKENSNQQNAKSKNQQPAITTQEKLKQPRLSQDSVRKNSLERANAQPSNFDSDKPGKTEQHADQGQEEGEQLVLQHAKPSGESKRDSGQLDLVSRGSMINQNDRLINDVESQSSDDKALVSAQVRGKQKQNDDQIDKKLHQE